MKYKDRVVVWMCGACGKVADEREYIGDESCWIWGVRVWKDSITYDSKGRANGAEAIPPEVEFELDFPERTEDEPEEGNVGNPG